MHHCSAITLGRVAWICPEGIAPHLGHFVGPWCAALRHIRDDVEKGHAFLGLCRLLRLNPQVLHARHALQICSCSCKSIFGSMLGSSCQQLFVLTEYSTVLNRQPALTRTHCVPPVCECSMVVLHACIEHGLCIHPFIFCLFFVVVSVLIGYQRPYSRLTYIDCVCVMYSIMPASVRNKCLLCAGGTAALWDGMRSVHVLEAVLRHRPTQRDGSGHAAVQAVPCSCWPVGCCNRQPGSACQGQSAANLCCVELPYTNLSFFCWAKKALHMLISTPCGVPTGPYPCILACNIVAYPDLVVLDD